MKLPVSLWWRSTKWCSNSSKSWKPLAVHLGKPHEQTYNWMTYSTESGSNLVWMPLSECFDWNSCRWWCVHVHAPNVEWYAPCAFARSYIICTWTACLVVALAGGGTSSTVKHTGHTRAVLFSPLCTTFDAIENEEKKRTKRLISIRLVTACNTDFQTLFQDYFPYWQNHEAIWFVRSDLAMW